MKTILNLILNKWGLAKYGMQYRVLVNRAIHLQSPWKVLSTVSWSTGELSNSQEQPRSKQLVMELFRKELKRAQTPGFTGRSCPSHFILTNPVPQESICCWATCIMYVWRVLRYRWNSVLCCHKVNATFYFNWGGGGQTSVVGVVSRVWSLIQVINLCT
jgi:hypothetical protein